MDRLVSLHADQKPHQVMMRMLSWIRLPSEYLYRTVARRRDAYGLMIKCVALLAVLTASYLPLNHTYKTTRH